MAGGEMSEDEFTDFLTQAFMLLVRYSTAGSIHFVCMDWRHMAQVVAAGLEAYTEFKNLCVWAKDTAGMGSLYRSAHELIFVFKSGTGRHRNNVQLGQFGRNRTNVWRCPGAMPHLATVTKATFSPFIPLLSPSSFLPTRCWMPPGAEISSWTLFSAAERP